MGCVINLNFCVGIALPVLHILGICIYPSVPQSHCTGETENVIFASGELLLPHPGALGSGAQCFPQQGPVMSRAEEQMNLGEQCPVFAQMSPPECRDGKDPLAHPAHGCQASGRSALALYFFVFCPVQTVSIY